MTPRSNKTFQHPSTPGSLSSALQSWQSVPSQGRDTAILHIVFTLSCWSQSRATRVAGFLRRRASCAVTRIHQVTGGQRDSWQVDGAMHPAIYGLADLEATWTWLRRAAHSQQVELVRVNLAETAA